MMNFAPPVPPARPGNGDRAGRPPPRDIVIVHSSDLHVDHDYTAHVHGGDGTAGLACVLDAASKIAADVVLLAGDTFECHRLPADLLERAAAVIAGAGRPVVVLPGNHDPAVPDAVYHHRALAEVANLHVLGVAERRRDPVCRTGARDLGPPAPRLSRHDPVRDRARRAAHAGRSRPGTATTCRRRTAARGCARPGSSAMPNSRRPAPTTSRSATGIAPSRSATAPPPPTTPARPNMPARSMCACGGEVVGSGPLIRARCGRLDSIRGYGRPSSGRRSLRFIAVPVVTAPSCCLARRRTARVIGRCCGVGLWLSADGLRIDTVEHDAQDKNDGGRDCAAP